jgi:hypothetical protein
MKKVKKALTLTTSLIMRNKKTAANINLVSVYGTKRSRSLKPFVPHLALAPQPRYGTCTRRW